MKLKQPANEAKRIEMDLCILESRLRQLRKGSELDQRLSAWIFSKPVPPFHR